MTIQQMLFGGELAQPAPPPADDGVQLVGYIENSGSGSDRIILDPVPGSNSNNIDLILVWMQDGSKPTITQQPVATVKSAWLTSTNYNNSEQPDRAKRPIMYASIFDNDYGSGGPPATVTVINNNGSSKMTAIRMSFDTTTIRTKLESTQLWNDTLGGPNSSGLATLTNKHSTTAFTHTTPTGIPYEDEPFHSLNCEAKFVYVHIFSMCVNPNETPMYPTSITSNATSADTLSPIKTPTQLNVGSTKSHVVYWTEYRTNTVGLVPEYNYEIPQSLVGQGQVQTASMWLCMGVK